MLAIQAEKAAAAAALLAGGADPKRVNKHGADALFSACFQGNLGLAKALAQAGADNEGDTPRAVAERWGKPQCAALLRG